MDLKDATLMFLTESAAHPAVAEIAQSAYDRLIEGEEVDYRVLSDLVGEASGKGVLRAMRQKYGPVAFEAMVMPILREVGRRAPIQSSRSTWSPGEDPLTAGVRRRYEGPGTLQHGRPGTGPAGPAQEPDGEPHLLTALDLGTGVSTFWSGPNA